ncbi:MULTISPECIES: SbcC/MukB-like Walker B domain-containing protein [unclassified Rathayibacter]|uniref:ATP-binding protein n=1 Tax=unclassified Rathayibacter TaxID=2609250 RepID=UPI001043E760|nr:MULTISPECIES: SbcC/MukB-like Walker B domain-containing protein [unclassified Rathayibacter]TCL77545.1 uncharacterized protein YPO0396 [Rathayibacter sp. PhB192]TCM29644.1 uncharacterized protein YPO0396 [Rathayibacter sp. PhB179]
MTMLTFDDDASDVTPGSEPTRQWRLAEVELFNWGTFSGRVRIGIARSGHLLTGASGSGKSSVLDGIAAVVTPDRWLRLNAAAQDGASRQSDRSLMSYVRGAWTKEVDESSDRATTTFLRSRATWSGVLLRYENLHDEPVVLARVFHAPGTRTETTALKDARIFTRGDLDIVALAPHVASGIDARRMSAALPDALITTGGKHGRFHERVVRHFGFRSDTTLQLLHKTQSAKNLGTLDALFRGFMLESPATFARADNAVEQFVELDQAHAHVVDLRRQADALRSLDASITAFDLASAESSSVAQLHDAVEPYTDSVKRRLAHEALGPARATLARARSRLSETSRQQAIARGALDTAVARVREEGGARVELLQERITAGERAEREVTRERDRLSSELKRIGVPLPADAAQFADLLATAAAELTKRVAPVPHSIRDAASETRKRLAAVEAQIVALREHRSNLDPRLLAARRFLARSLGVPDAAVPFAGELVAVLPEHAAWRGAIERVLAPLATTLLVPDDLLPAARRASDARHLGVRLVMEAVPEVSEPPRRPRDPRSLLHRVTVSEGPFTLFLRRRLASDFDFACVADADELDDVDRGVTIGGLVKRTSRRYEKDDRSAVSDATRWLLGGDTEARLDALLAQQREAERASATAAAADGKADAARESALGQRAVLERVVTVSWERIDLAAAAELSAAHRAELVTLTSRSSSLRDAQEAREQAASQLEDATRRNEQALREEAIAQGALERIESQLAALESAPPSSLDDSTAEALGARFRAERRSLTLETVDAIARAVQSALSREKDIAARRSGDAAAAFAAGAAAFRAAWPAASADLTAEIEDRYGYRALLEGILSRGLPEKESDFRRLLRERSRDVVAHLLGDLRDAPGLVRERILPVNASLGRSPFEGRDRFLEIDIKTTRSPEVEDFLANLRRIVEGNWADESAAGAEQRFAVLRTVMGRLGSRDRVDQDWRARVLDTRLHVSFLAREKDAAGTVLRVYDSAEGLSGGQRQKLVIFCLAAALRYQLTEEEAELPRFGTIILDEAFDKADSRYTRNAMDVFRSFGFHMVLATPQKLLQTLEPYVGAITAVSNPDRNASRIADVVFSPQEAGGTPGEEQHR